MPTKLIDTNVMALTRGGMHEGKDPTLMNWPKHRN
jgi:hypothetical protein